MTKIPRIIFYLLWVVCLAGCARQADVGNPVRFNERPLAFDYPGNWKVTANEPLGAGRMVMLEESGSALVSITVYPPGVEVSLEDYGKHLQASMASSALAVLINRKDSGVHEANASLEFTFTVSIGTIQVPHTQVITRHAFGDFTVFCMSQVADEDRSLVQAGFDMIRGSLAVAR